MILTSTSLVALPVDCNPSWQKFGHTDKLPLSNISIRHFSDVFINWNKNCTNNEIAFQSKADHSQMCLFS